MGREILQNGFFLSSSFGSSLLPCRVLDFPNNIKTADFMISVAKLNMFRKEGFKMPPGKPAQVAEGWAAAVVPSELIQACVADAGYLNILLRPEVTVAAVIGSVLEKKSQYGHFDFGEGKTIYCEYSSPNIAKPFHAGHLRSTVIGSFIAKLHQACGYTVISENYLGDWGKQYGLLAVGFKRFGDAELLKSEPIKHLFEIYVKINKQGEIEPEVHDEARLYFSKMEKGDQEALKVWSEMREMSIREYKKIYERLNVSFDIYGGESKQTAGMVTQLKVLEEKGLLESPEEAKGAKLIDLEKFKLGKVVVVKKDGSTLYITRDIATAVSRWEEHHFDHMFYVVAKQQDLHFQQLFKTLNLMGHDFDEKCTHINFGMVKGMKTRTGEVVFLSDILDEAQRVMLEQMKASSRSKFDQIADPEATADIVGLSAVVIQDLTAKRGKDYAFDWERVTSFEGDTGPYLQYAHARMCSIEEKALEGKGWSCDDLKPDYKLIQDESCRILAYQIGRYPFMVYSAIQQLEASTIVNYLYDLCHAISSAHVTLNVLKADSEAEGKARLAIFHSARLVVGHALKMLGLKPLERM